MDGAFQTHIAASYSFTSIPARFALERQQWSEAAVLEPRLPMNYPIENFPAMEAITYYARALGAARSGNVKYETTLRRSPNRFNSLYGAGLAAELGNNKSEAVFYYKKIVKITATVKTDREQLKHAKLNLSQTGDSS